MYSMSDGLNQARAMRIAEIVADYRNIHQRISQIRANPSAEEYNEVGFVLLRQCENEARAVLASPFAAMENNPNINNNHDEEQTKLHLRRIILDASVRRFRVQRNLVRMAAALRWVQTRASILRGARPNPSHAAALNQCTQTLRQDLNTMTDARIEAGLRDADAQAGKWTQEDPSLATIQRALGS